MKAYKRWTQKSENYEGIVIKLRRTGQSQVVTIYTVEKGLVRVLYRRHKQTTAAITPLGKISFSAAAQGDILLMGEFECRLNAAIRELTWERFIYSQIFLEMLSVLVPPTVADRAVYRLLLQYTAAFAYKDPRIVTIIAGWQLVGLAGFYPDTQRLRVTCTGRRENRGLYYVGETLSAEQAEVDVPESVRQMWQTLLTYRWGQRQIIHLQEKGLQFLEDLLYSYVEQWSEKKLKSPALR